MADLGKRLLENEEDSLRGMEFLQRAVDRGNESAHVSLSKHLRARNNEDDVAKGERLLREGVTLGLRGCMATLGLLLLERRGSADEVTEGRTLLEKATARGSRETAALLGVEYYQHGYLEQAAAWLRMAVDRGVDSAATIWHIWSGVAK